MDAKRGDVAGRMLAWYDAHARVLPWRVAPGLDADPYRVWLSEVMLQQTTVAAVRPRFEAWVARWPDVAALAAADEAEVMAAWAGLGYYARARNLVKAARAVAAAGAFPDTEEGLRALPGLGAYTAAAVAAIAFGARAVVVDANVERVVARLFAIREKGAAIRAAADSITPRRRAGDFAQAMMDLGATICTARAPQCLLCPLREGCAGHAAGDPEAYPARKPKPAKPRRYGTIFWLERPAPPIVGAEPAAALPAANTSLAARRPSTSSGRTGGGETDSVPPVRAEPVEALPAASGLLAARHPSTSSGRTGDGETDSAPPVRAEPVEALPFPSEVFLVRRPGRGLLGGMRAFPTGPWADAPPGIADAPADAAWQFLPGTVVHTFTHFHLELALARARVDAHSPAGGEWWRVDRLDEAGLPTVFAKAAAAIRRDR